MSRYTVSRIDPNKLVLFTDEVLRNLPSSRHGKGFLRDKEISALQAVKFDHHKGKVAFQIRFGALGDGIIHPCGYIINGESVMTLTLGFWPDMSIADAKAQATQVLAEFYKQREQGLTAPPKRKVGVRKPPKPRRPKAITVEDLLKEERDIPEADRDKYETLMGVLMEAYGRAAFGKGDERHGGEQSFDQQPMMKISDALGNTDGPYYQSIKKILEARKMKDKKVRRLELLDAIVYLAGVVVWNDQQ